MDPAVALAAFVLIFPVELPDKTFVAALVLATRYQPWAVWIGVGLAFGVQCAVAVTAGQLVSLLPHVWIEILSTAMFLAGAVILFLQAPNADRQEVAQEEEFEAKASSVRTGLRAVVASFVLIFAAEWGDLSQILTLNLTAKYGSPFSIFVGSWLALLVVSGIAVLTGRILLRYVRLSTLHYVASVVCLGFAGAGVVAIASG